jgi:hypothetical protein
MDAEDTTTTIEREEDDEEGLGTSFFLKLAGIVAGIGLLVGIGLLIFFRAIYAWGFIGAFLAFGLVMLVWAWIHDRRDTHS